MGVFLRWGVFGILSVAALVYAYNASKRMAGNRPEPVVLVVNAPEPARDELADEEEDPDEDAPQAATRSGPERMVMPPLCEEELQIAERALKMRRDGEPLDRLLRIDRIIFQADEQRRERLALVARAWFEREGRDPDAAALGAQVLRDCELARAASPAP